MSLTQTRAFPQFDLATELASKSFTDTVCSVDMALMRESKGFLRNETQYYLAINTWLAIINHVEGPDVMAEVKGIIRKKGLVYTVKLAANTADYVISVLTERPITPASDVIGFESLFTTNDIRNLLLCLRFLKRFTLISCTTLQKATYDAFEKIQNRLNWRWRAAQKLDSRDPDVWWPRTRFDDTVRGYISRMTHNWKSYFMAASGSFSNGASSDGATVVAKLSGYSEHSAYLDDPMFPMPLLSLKWPVARDISEGAPCDPLVVKAVPKSYKTYRLIAPESAYNNFNMQKLRKALEMALYRSGYGDLFPIDDQTEQQARAYASSLTGEFATLDSSSASDSIATYRMKDLLDPELFELLSSSRPRKYRLGKDGKCLTASTWLTSGHPCTFILEGIFFLAIAFAAREWHARWTGEWGKRPSVFGDDLIVDMVYYEETIDLLTRYGITVNVEKSFSFGKYRESCGVEYFDGLPTRNVYWPRKGISEHRELSVEDYESLVALQHRLFSVPPAARFLAEFVRLQWPSVTSSLPGTDNGDLWANVPVFDTKLAPIGAYWRKDYKKPVLSEEIAEVATREVHFGPITEHEKCTDFGSIILSDVYYYYRFLADGPIYADPISQLLGVSEPQLRGGAFSKPKRRLGKRTLT